MADYEDVEEQRYLVLQRAIVNCEEYFLHQQCCYFNWDDANNFLEGTQNVFDYYSKRAAKRQQQHQQLREQSDTNKDCTRDINEVYCVHIACSIHKQVTYVDDWGNTALHIAAFHNAPVDTVKRMVKLSSYAFPNLNVLSHVSSDGSTPFLVACCVGASLDNLKEYLRNYDKEDCSGTGIGGPKCDYQRHIASIADFRGGTPLENIISRPDLNHGITNKGKINFLVQLILGTRPIEENGYNDEEESEDHEFLLNALATVPSACCSKDFILASIQHTSLDFLSGAQVPCHLSKPPLLHLAISRSVVSSTFTDMHRACILQTRESMLKQLKKESIVISCLLEAYPTAAKIGVSGGETRKGKGSWRNPLCHAIESGFSWHIMSISNANSSSKSTFRYADSPEAHVGPLQHLWKYAPEALGARDMISGLYPFMLAATVAERNDAKDVTPSNWNCPKGIEGTILIMQINTIYGLLRSNPQVMDIVLDDI
jgi:hypothetical protein